MVGLKFKALNISICYVSVCFFLIFVYCFWLFVFLCVEDRCCGLVGKLVCCVVDTDVSVPRCLSVVGWMTVRGKIKHHHHILPGRGGGLIRMT